MAVKQNNSDRKIGGSSSKSAVTEILAGNTNSNSNNSNSVKMDRNTSLSKILDLIDLLSRSTSLTVITEDENELKVQEKLYSQIFCELTKVEIPRSVSSIEAFKRDITEVINFFKKMPAKFYHPLLEKTCILIAKESLSCAILVIFQVLPIKDTEQKSIKREVSSLITAYEDIPDLDLVRFIEILCNWVTFCTYFCPNMHNWIIEIFEKLRQYDRYNIVNDVAIKVIKPLCAKLIIPFLRPKLAPIIFDILSSESCSAEVFIVVCEFLPVTLDHLKRETNAETKEIYDEFIKIISNRINKSKSKENATKRSTVKTVKVPVANPQILEKRLTRSRKNSKTGLVNVNNNCYMNSVIQALLMTPGFRNRVLMISIETDMFNELHNIFSELISRAEDYVTPTGCLRTFKPAHFINGSQEDSSEFLLYFLSALHEHELQSSLRINENPLTQNVTSPLLQSPARDLTIIEKLFCGRSISSLSCRACGRMSRSSDNFRELQIAIPNNFDSEDFSITSRYNLKELTIQNLIDKHFSSELLINDGNSGYSCPVCRNIHTTECRNYLVNPPNYLILHLKQFHYDMSRGIYIKLSNRIRLSEYVELKSYDENSNNVDNCNVILYKMYAVIVHYGTLVNCGHYYTYAIDDENQWHKFNDHEVRKCKFTDILNLKPPHTPYIVFYRQINDNNDYTNVTQNKNNGNNDEGNTVTSLELSSQMNTADGNRTTSVNDLKGNINNIFDNSTSTNRSRPPNNFDILRSLNTAKRLRGLETEEENNNHKINNTNDDNNDIDMRDDFYYDNEEFY